MKYICKICGYIHNSAELPSDFTCPLCGHPAEDFEPIYDPDVCSRVPFWVAWKYDLQAAVYQEIVRQNTGKQLPFFLAAATKEKVTDYNIFQIVQSDLDIALQTVKENIVRFDAVKNGLIEADRCGECEYCRETKKLTEVIQSDSILI